MSAAATFNDDELLPLSALQHLVFCRRQCALIYLEGQWKDNPLTLEGSHLHQRTDESAPRRELRGDTVILRGLELKSVQHGLSGRADIVELHQADDGRPAKQGSRDCVSFPGLQGLWCPFPIEYKRGKPKTGPCDRVQLCAQALCLEEMLDVCIPCGALFYGKQQRREAVNFDPELRRLTAESARNLHALIDSRVTPLPKRTKACDSCSLLELCLPDAAGGSRSVRRYIDRCSK